MLCEPATLERTSIRDATDDEDETHDFSHGMVKAYFTQAHNTFDKMDVAL